MSKLSASLRDSITAEKESVKKKLIPTKAAKKAGADKNKPVAKPGTESNESAVAKDKVVEVPQAAVSTDKMNNSAKENNLAKEKSTSKHTIAAKSNTVSKSTAPKIVAAKKVTPNKVTPKNAASNKTKSRHSGDAAPTAHTSDKSGLLNKADVLGKINQNMVQASSAMTDIIKECLEAPLISMNEMLNLNTNTSYSLLDRVSNMINQVSHTHNPFEFWACVNNMVAQSMNNSQNYLKNLSANIHESRTKISGAINKQQRQAVESFSNIFTPWKLLAE